MVKEYIKKIILLPVSMLVVFLFYNKTEIQVRILDTEILPHPILFTADEEKATKARFGSILLLDSLHARLMECAGQLLRTPVQAYGWQTRLEISREQIYRMVR
jgi:hypothetical protein